MRIVNLDVDKLAFGGAGVGRVDGKACFIPYTAPGDEIRAEVTLDKASFMRCELLDVITQSPVRVRPPCPVFGKCGGCSWQHLSYEAQLEAKENIFAETLWRFGRIPRESIGSIVPAESPFGYRTRAQFKVSFAGGGIQLGFYRTGTHDVVDIPGQCAVLSAKINAALPEIRSVLRSFPEPDRIPQIDAATGTDDALVLIVHYTGDKREALTDFFANNRTVLAKVSGLFLRYGNKSTISKVFGADSLSYIIPERLIDGMPQLELSYSRGGFSQVNYLQNLSLIRLAAEYARLTGSESLLDLYCGNGNFSIPLSFAASVVVGVEGYGPSCEDAERNRRAHSVSNCRFITADAVKGLDILAASDERFDVILLDPPREGAKDAIDKIVRFKPSRIVYVSCDPSTLGRDLGLFGQSGYTVEASRPVDMFPQTYHIESVTLLTKV